MSKVMKPFANDDDTPWDTINIVVVLRAHLEKEFMRQMTPSPSLWDAKHILMKLNKVVEGRNLRAHWRHPTEAEVVDSLSCINTLLRWCGCDHHAVGETTRLLDDAKLLIECGGKDPRAKRQVSLPDVVDRDALVLYKVCSLFLLRCLLWWR
jgi:hypothetical protein